MFCLISHTACPDHCNSCTYDSAGVLKCDAGQCDSGYEPDADGTCGGMFSFGNHLNSRSVFECLLNLRYAYIFTYLYLHLIRVFVYAFI